MKPEISIIIPTLHRKNSLLRLLDSLLKEFKRKSFEVIIVEQGENNGGVYKAFAKKNGLTLKYLFFDERNTAKAKNAGAAQAGGEYFLFYDDDVVLHKGAVENLMKNFQDKKVGAAGGRVLTPGQTIEPNRTDVGRLTPWGTFSGGFSSTVRQDISTLIGCHMAFRADVFRGLGGFDGRYTGAIREDSDLSLRVKAAGYRAVFDPTAVVTHLREQSGGGRKSEGRIAWYYNFFSNETYFFLKHCKKLFFPIFLALHTEWALRCMFGFGREVSMRSITTPFAGIMDGIRKYYDYRR